jgi:GDP-D-mannose dehydratase
VVVSFEAPESTANSDAFGTLRILEAVRMLGLTAKIRDGGGGYGIHRGDPLGYQQT